MINPSNKLYIIDAEDVTEICINEKPLKFAAEDEAELTTPYSWTSISFTFTADLCPAEYRQHKLKLPRYQSYSNA